MTDTDRYRDLLAETLGQRIVPVPRPQYDDADDVLATHVDFLCPDCHGQGVIDLPEYEGNLPTCSHPDAPTVAALLAAGERVWTAKPVQRGRHFGTGLTYEDGDADGQNRRLAALRGENTP